MWRTIDRNLWTLPLLVFVLSGGLVVIFDWRFHLPISFTSTPLRQQFYSSLTGSSSSLLGFLIAAVTIIAAFGRRYQATASEGRREDALATARAQIIILLLIAAMLMLFVLLAATVALSMSNSPNRLYVLDGLIIASSTAALVGVVTGAVALGLAVIERGPG
jgi:uncharacterized membrane protein YjgN (DUF898 family)